jgi:recombinational DNA repair ATPase RecF
MKIKNISLSNFSKYDSVSVSFDDNITYLVGKNGSRKSTLGLTAIWFMFEGIAEKASQGKSPLIGERFRFIGPKGATAKGEMILVDEKSKAEIKVTRKLTKSGTEVFFEGPEGMEIGQKWLTDLFNVFLIAPKMFCELSPKEQAKVLGIDTKTFDEAIARLKQEYTAQWKRQRKLI